MIHAITATNYLGEDIRMVLPRPETSGFVIFNVEGLGPPKANINVSEVANLDGGLFNSSRATARNIVLSIKNMQVGNLLVEDTRHLTYKFFPLQKEVKITVETDRRTTEIYGHVESNTPNIFSSQQFTQISIICPRPYFQATNDNTTVFSGVEPLFEFPFSNESLTDNLLLMGDIKQSTIETIMYDGDVETGIVIHMLAAGEVINPVINNVETGEIIKLTTTMLSGDEIIISTVPGDKYIMLLRNGIYTNILNKAVTNRILPDWLTLRRGHNTFAYKADDGVENLHFSITDRPLYEGI